MKDLFPQYNHSDSLNYSNVWQSALFVFDTNVLLNLYRYHESTRTELLDILKSLENRIWIPHHVGLEFHRNRISVIATQGNGFKEMREILNSTKNKLKDDIYQLGLHNRHTLINAEKLIHSFDELTTNFAKELETLEASQQKISDPDPIKKIIDDLFSGKVGPAYSQQCDIDDLSKKAETRYKLKIPPGYKDDEKDKNKPDDFMHNGIFYKRKYGDYIAWSQILKKAESLDSKQLIFITDDGKEDWWHKLNADGSSNNLGPRIELIDEAINIGKLDAFLMYKPEGFLKYAKKFLAATVSDESLNEARQVSTTNTQTQDLPEIKIHDFNPYNVESAVRQWLEEHTDKVDGPRLKFPDFIVDSQRKKIGIEVFLYKPSLANNELRLFKTVSKLANNKSDQFDSLQFFWAVSCEEHKDMILDLLVKEQQMLSGITIHIGLFEMAGTTPRIAKTWFTRQ